MLPPRQFQINFKHGGGGGTKELQILPQNRPIHGKTQTAILRLSLQSPSLHSPVKGYLLRLAATPSW